jgi:hypothetical protein
MVNDMDLYTFKSDKPNPADTKQIYTVRYGIDGGISHGFGFKTPDYTTIDKIIEAKDDLEALGKAAKEAYRLSRIHLSNPNTDYTTVTILQLYNSMLVLLDQRKIVEKQKCDGVAVNGRSFEWKDNTLTIACSMLEHILTL